MRVCRSLLPLLLFGCSSSSTTPADAGVPLDMHVGPTKLASVTTLTGCLAVDDNFVYWSDAAPGATPTIAKVAVTGGPLLEFVGGDPSTCVAVDGSGIYYFDSGAVMKAPLGPGANNGPAAALATGQHAIKGAPLVAAGGYVYWITDVYGDVDAYNGKNAIVRVSTTAGTPVEIISAEVVGNPGGLAVDATNVYYSDQSGVWARALAAPATAIAFGQSTLHDNALAVGNGHVAMNEIAGIGMGDVAVFRPDGMARVVVSPSLAQPLAVDDRGVYVNGMGSLERLALDGSGTTVLATEQPRAVALSATTIFFTDDSAIYSLPK